MTVEIVNDGVADDGRSVVGNGLTGLAERVSALGGRLRAERTPDGEFRLRAVLPDFRDVATDQATDEAVGR